MAIFRYHQQGVRVRHGSENDGSLRSGELRDPRSILLSNHGAQEVPQWWPQRNSLAHAYQNGASKEGAMAGELRQQRPDEQLEGHHRAHGISGQTDPGPSLEKPKADRSAGTHPNAPELKVEPQLPQHRADMIVIAHADTGGRDND